MNRFLFPGIISFLVLGVGLGCSSAQSNLENNDTGGISHQGDFPNGFLQSCRAKYGQDIVVKKSEASDGVVGLGCIKKYSRVDPFLAAKYRNVVQSKVSHASVSSYFDPKCPLGYERIEVSYSTDQSISATWLCRPKGVGADIIFKPTSSGAASDAFICGKDWKYEETTTTHSRLDFLDMPVNEVSISMINHKIWSGKCSKISKN